MVSKSNPHIGCQSNPHIGFKCRFSVVLFVLALLVGVEHLACLFVAMVNPILLVVGWEPLSAEVAVAVGAQQAAFASAVGVVGLFHSSLLSK